MAKFRRTRAHARVSSPATKVSTIVDRRFDDRLVTIDWKGKQNKLTKLAPASSSCGSSPEFGKEDPLALDQERSYSRPVAGTPMKKLLADEMSKGTESRRRSPSIIAKLMGLDGLPAQQNTSKQQKISCDNRQQNAGSVGSRKSSKLCDSRTQRKDARGQHLFKDVYEVAESLDKETRIHSSHVACTPNPNEDKIAFVRQKFIDVKRFSTDEKLQNSEEFYDALEVLDSNKDILLKFLQEPNSLFAKHLRDFHGSPESHCGHVLSMKTANTLKGNIDATGCQLGGKASRKIDINHSQKHWDGVYGDLPHRSNTDFHKLNFSAEDTKSAAPTRIVVLKPNLGKVQSIARSVSSPSPSHGSISDLDLHNECPNILHSGSEIRGRRSMHKDFDAYEFKYRESRELAKEITRRMKCKLETDSFNISSSGHKGYSADESSREDSENELSYESELTIASSRTSYTRSIHNRASTLHHEESAVNKEAKRRLSERWKMTCRSQEVEASSRGSTLAEMLAIPDMDMRPRNLDDIVNQDESIRRSTRKEVTAEIMLPLGISSRDGWKDGCIRDLSRCRSLPSSSGHVRTPKSSTRHETLATERFFVRKESIHPGRSKTLNRDSKRNEGSFTESPRPSNKKSEFSCPVSMEIIHDAQEVQFSWNMVPKRFDGEDSPEPKSVILKVSSGRHDSDLATSPVMDKEYEIVSKSMNCPDELVPSPHRSSGVPLQSFSTCAMQSVEQEPSTNCEVGSSSSLQCAATQPESPSSSKESEQPSPVSVLEPAIVDDISSGSKCFERVSAELHGLRMQLQLLKLESEASEAYDEGSMVISSDEDGEESGESHDHEGCTGARESWMTSYLVDVLTESGLDEMDSDLFVTTWHSPDCPIGHDVFENLERRYDERDSCSKLERKQLFDCINSQIMEISHRFIYLHPWVKSPTADVLPQWWKNVLRAELHKLIELHERKGAEIASAAEILGGMQWMELADHIDAIGRDIELLLIGDLVAELMM